jgi:hypothetical protein
MYFINTYGGVGVKIHISIRTLVGGECSYSRPKRCIIGERALANQWIGDWLGLSPGLDSTYGEVKKFYAAKTQMPTPRSSSP